LPGGEEGEFEDGGGEDGLPRPPRASLLCLRVGLATFFFVPARDGDAWPDAVGEAAPRGGDPAADEAALAREQTLSLGEEREDRLGGLVGMV
jgi:hypothetical protein